MSNKIEKIAEIQKAIDIMYEEFDVKEIKQITISKKTILVKITTQNNNECTARIVRATR